MNKKVQHTSLNLGYELWKKVKIEAVKRDMSTTELVILALKKELNIK